MANDWETIFQNWAKPPSDTEQTRCDNVLGVVRNAISSSPALDNRRTTVFAQGSYRNRTNVRTDSDVDVCVLCRDTFFFDLPGGMTSEDFGIIPATYSYTKYKSDIEDALVSYLGRQAITRGNKAFDVHQNTYRVDADVVACFEYRRYSNNGSYLEGTSFETAKGIRVVNWPQQNYDNGVAKNEATSKRFKAVVRVLKKLRNEMDENGYSEAKVMPSYLIECLVWNVPNQGFGHYNITGDVRYAIVHLYNNTQDFEKCREWGEINELKYLFRTSQPWKREQVNDFLLAAWNHIGFE